MFENLTKMKVYSILVGVFCGCILMSNILGTKTLNMYFIALPCSILIFPLLFIVNDILSEIYGFKMTKDVIYLGFILNIIAVTLYAIAIMLPSNSDSANAFSKILGSTPRLLLAGICSYFAGNFLNSKVLIKLKKKYHELLFVRCVGSTIVGEAADSFIFITVAFYGIIPNYVLLTMICCQIIFKVLYEIIVYPVTRIVIYRIREIDDGELEGIIPT